MVIAYPRLRGGCFTCDIYARLPLRFGDERYHPAFRNYFQCCSLTPNSKLQQTNIPPIVEFVAIIPKWAYSPFNSNLHLTSSNILLFECSGLNQFAQDKLDNPREKLKGSTNKFDKNVMEIIFSYLEPIVPSSLVVQEDLQSNSWLIILTPKKPLQVGHVYRWEMIVPDRKTTLFHVC
jgi:hypothetical protein